jgi:hypothetical protein
MWLWWLVVGVLDSVLIVLSVVIVLMVDVGDLPYAWNYGVHFLRFSSIGIIFIRTLLLHSTDMTALSR